MVKIKGFAEWLPEHQLLQDEIIATIKEQFQLHGFAPLLTRSIEHLEDLLDQGETDKEIYAVNKLGSDSQAEWGLHYDLTVPFARYVSENQGRLQFPYRRYQIQPAWRGERPQLGRFREFIQADADIVNKGSLELRHDADLLSMFQNTLSKLPIPATQMVINNRKLLQGFYQGLGVDDIVPVLRAVDKLPKVGSEETLQTLIREGLSDGKAQAVLDLCAIKATSSEELEVVGDLGVSSELLSEGLAELGEVLDRANSSTIATPVAAALHIARGFDYYTGTVAETEMLDYPDVGSICSGGRYENLVHGDREAIPGVGFSIGVTRLISYGLNHEFLSSEKVSPATVLVAVNSEDKRADSDAVANQLRRRGIACMVSDSDAAYGKQIKVAERLGIDYVWFPQAEGDEVKSLGGRSQEPADSTNWVPNS